MDNLCMLQIKITICFTEALHKPFLLYQVLFRKNQVQDIKAISQHKPLFKHMTNNGHVFHVSSTSILHFLLQLLLWTSVRTARS